MWHTVLSYRYTFEWKRFSFKPPKEIDCIIFIMPTGQVIIWPKRVGVWSKSIRFISYILYQFIFYKSAKLPSGQISRLFIYSEPPIYFLWEAYCITHIVLLSWVYIFFQLGFGKDTKYGNRLRVYNNHFWFPCRTTNRNFDESLWSQVEPR